MMDPDENEFTVIVIAKSRMVKTYRLKICDLNSSLIRFF